MPDPQPPISDKQLAANRANAARSTGPRTPEGKARSARNAVKHGFTASTFGVIRLEDLQEIARLKQDLVSVYQPVNAQELFALERMALAQQSILRAARLEAGLFTTCLNETLGPRDHPYIEMNSDMQQDIEITRAQNRNYLLAEGFHTIARQNNSWNLFLRYQAQAERLYRRALEDFERLKKLRPELPNEPILECPPEADEPLFVPFGMNPIEPPEPPAVPSEPPPPAAPDASAPVATPRWPPFAPHQPGPVPMNQPENRRSPFSRDQLRPSGDEFFDIHPQNV